MPGDHARTALAGSRFADLRWVESTGSTNADLLELARGGAPDGIVLVADHQSAGRGRLDRTWTAPAGSSLLFSTLVRPDLAPSDLHLLTTAVAVAASDACEAVAGVRPRLKWPNDLVVADGDGTDRKLAGILSESVVDGGEVRAVVVGMGLNVNWPATLPDDLAATATSLNHLAGHDVDREQLLVAHLRGLEVILAELASPGGREALIIRYRHLSATLGRTVRVELASGALVGQAVDVDDAGHLVVELGGELVPVVAGDVVHLRTQD
ncbi:biotin--[acetyl-CoA-carboxylase] ligase [Actinomarinicola tropica]|nr:biotin--[acetyl-CoA-carboxylase] ligase [Actinomarinicola tropica]